MAEDQDTARVLTARAPDLPADALIIVPVRQTVLFPGTVFPITIGRPRIGLRRFIRWASLQRL